MPEDMPDTFDLEHIRFKPDQISIVQTPTAEFVKRPRGRPRKFEGDFLAGPIPGDWLKAVAKLPGNALHVAIYVCMMMGKTRKPTVAVSMHDLAEWGLSRRCVYHALRILEQSGLMAVERHHGRLARVTMQQLPEGWKGNWDNSNWTKIGR